MRLCDSKVGFIGANRRCANTFPAAVVATLGPRAFTLIQRDYDPLIGATHLGQLPVRSHTWTKSSRSTGQKCMKKIVEVGILSTLLK